MQAPHPGIGCLPDDLLARILVEVPFLERQRALPLVCRSWSKLVVAPCLLRQLSFDTVSLAGSFARGGAPEPARRLPLARSFFGWLVVHAAGHVEQLHLCIGTPYNNEADTAAFFPEIASALAACGGGLREVRLYLQLRHLRFPAALAAALRGVRLLHLEVEEGDLTLDVPLGGMRQLEQLWLQGSPSDASSAGLEVAASASLPPSLTQLHLGGTRWDPGEDAALLPQLAGLTRLRDLSLHALEYALQGYEVLAQLGGCLERLRLENCSWLPSADVFAALTRLTLLSVDTIGDQREAFDDFSAAMDATLEALPQLQHLRCSFASSSYIVDVPSLPVQLTRLQSLQRLWWDIEAADSRLPRSDGAWLQGLHHLALTASAIAGNQDRLLAATPHLQSLHVLCQDYYHTAELLPEALQFVLRHPALRQVHVRLPHLSIYFSEADAASSIQHARQQRPNVRIASSTTPVFNLGAAFDGEHRWPPF